LRKISLDKQKAEAGKTTIENIKRGENNEHCNDPGTHSSRDQKGSNGEARTGSKKGNQAAKTAAGAEQRFLRIYDYDY